jgi:hypothetical protein
LGWTDGRNVRIDTRWSAGDADRSRRYAAELFALAPDVVAGSTRRLLGNLFHLRDLGRHELKGITEPVAAWAVEGVSESESRFEAARAAGLTDLIGRENELDFLLERQRLAWQLAGLWREKISSAQLRSPSNRILVRNGVSDPLGSRINRNEEVLPNLPNARPHSMTALGTGLLRKLAAAEGPDQHDRARAQKNTLQPHRHQHWIIRRIHHQKCSHQT